MLSPVNRVERLLNDAHQRLADAVCALNAACVGSDHERYASIRFIKHGLQLQAAMIGRVNDVLAAEMERAAAEDEAPTATRRAAP
jgi:hypothetical protein